jgi:hypothetical protein
MPTQPVASQGLTRAPRRARIVAAVSACVACAALLVILGLMPVPQLANRIGSAGGHIAVYAAVVMVSFAFVTRTRWRLAVLAAFWLLGVLIELAQANVTWRSGSLNDIGYNTIGLAFGVLVFLGLERTWRRFAPRGAAATRRQSSPSPDP